MSGEEELKKIRGLISRLDEICREAEQIRHRLESTRQTRIWPDPRLSSRLFSEAPAMYQEQTGTGSSDPTSN